MDLGPEPPPPPAPELAQSTDAVFVPAQSGTPPAEPRAVYALVLGSFSVLTCGLTAIPAVIFGILARGEIARSRGALGGRGMATAGIVTGVLGAIVTAVGVVALAASFFVNARAGWADRSGSSAAPKATTAWSPVPFAHGGVAGAQTIGAIRVFDLDPDAKRSFHQQLGEEYARAKADGRTVVLMTSARWCSVCRELEASLPDPRMQAALSGVDLVRVDIEEFDDELKGSGMLEDTLPWFYRLDATLRPVDAISAGEWDDNVPENMAPVLRSFLAGTLHTRRDPSGLGTAL